MSNHSEASDSFDPRTWLRGFDDVDEATAEARATPMLLDGPRSRMIAAATAGAAILMSGGAAAYLTRGAPQPVTIALADPAIGTATAP